MTGKDNVMSPPTSACSEFVALTLVAGHHMEARVGLRKYYHVRENTFFPEVLEMGNFITEETF